MRVDGSCLCEAIRFEAELDPEQVFLCHCADCQKHSGTTFRIVAGVVPEDFQLLAGKPRNYRKRAESGTERELGFCPTCGTSLYGRSVEGESGLMSLRVGTLRQRDRLPPVAQIWCDSSQTWLADLLRLPRIARQDPQEITELAKANAPAADATGSA